MPFEIKTSQLQDRATFEMAVATHLNKLRAFSKEVGKPRPIAPHPLIEASVKRVNIAGAPDKYIADYVIVDDSMALPPAVSLEDKKQRLYAELMVAETEAKYKILPQRKKRLAEVKMMIASQVKEDDRTAEQNEDIASFRHVQRQWQKIDLIGSQAESDIDDLDEDTVDNWQLPSFG